MNKIKSMIIISIVVLIPYVSQSIADDALSKSNIIQRFITSKKYSFKIAIPQDMMNKFPQLDMGPLQRIIDGYMDEDDNSVYVTETTANPYDQMSEKEFYNLNLKGLKQSFTVDDSGEIKIGNKAGYYVMCKYNKAPPNLYQGVIFMHVHDRAITIYVTHNNKKSFIPIWNYVIENSSFE